MEELRPNKERAKIAIMCIWIMCALEIVSLISGYFQYELLQVAANGGEISEETANANDLREQIIAIIFVVAYIISVITFIRWFRRAYYNHHLRVKNLSYTEGWAAGAWFVPFLNLFRPQQIMKELYETTSEYLTKKKIVAHEKITSNYVPIWWALWIIGGLVAQFVLRYSMKANTLDEVINSTRLGMVDNVIGIPLAVIAVKVITDYAKMESLLAEVTDDEESTADSRDEQSSTGSVNNEINE